MKYISALTLSCVLLCGSLFATDSDVVKPAKISKARFEIAEPYGVDEFMFFVEGSVTLTSADGSVEVINAGEAVTIPKEWTGTWDTDGYTKFWVIYSEDGSALE